MPIKLLCNNTINRKIHVRPPPAKLGIYNLESTPETIAEEEQATKTV